MSDSAHEIMIPSKNKRRRRDNKENRDRLTDLPECVLLHILSFLNSRYSVRTCVLSTRWKHIWKRVPTLILHSSDFYALKPFSLFVSRILTLRDRSIALHSLDFVRLRSIEPQLPKKIIKYVYSHNTHIHQLGINVIADSIAILNCISSCRALTSLKLLLYSRGANYNTKTLFPKSLNLPLLAILDLTHFTFCGDENGCAEPFSAFPMLNSLVIHCCNVKDAQIFNISNRTLVNLDMHDNSFKSPKIELSTPSLSTFTFHNRLICVTAETYPILNCISSCWALTSLKLSPRSGGSNYNSNTLFPKSLNLPLLTSLYLENFAFCGDETGCAEPFSAFPKLNSLVIRSCNVKDAQIFNISNNTLVNLDMHDNSFKFPKIELSTPSLFTFNFPKRLDQKVCGSGLSCVKQVNIDEQRHPNSVEHALDILSWLQDLANVESLKVTSITLQILSLLPDLLEVKLLSLCNLKSLEIKLISLL